MMKGNGLSVDDIMNGLKRIGKKEIEAVLQLPKVEPKPVIVQKTATRDGGRENISSLRRKLSERLVAVKSETAMLTTFNEIDMSYVMDLRTSYQQKFTETHVLKLGFMLFIPRSFATASDFAPVVKAQSDGTEIIIPR